MSTNSQVASVIVEQMSVVVDGRNDMSLDLTTGDLDAFKDYPLVLKEGIEYEIKITFRVQNEIISGLRYHHTISRKGVTNDTRSYMIGSYPPKSEPHIYFAPSDETPLGMIARGLYVVKSRVIDGDYNVHSAWEWSMDIRKDWE